MIWARFITRPTVDAISDKKVMGVVFGLCSCLGRPDVIKGLASYRCMLGTGFGVVRVLALGSSGGDLDGLVRG